MYYLYIQASIRFELLKSLCVGQFHLPFFLHQKPTLSLSLSLPLFVASTFFFPLYIHINMYLYHVCIVSAKATYINMSYTL